jgi:hypothetical protein
MNSHLGEVFFVIRKWPGKKIQGYICSVVLDVRPKHFFPISFREYVSWLEEVFLDKV